MRQCALVRSPPCAKTTGQTISCIRMRSKYRSKPGARACRCSSDVASKEQGKSERLAEYGWKTHRDCSAQETTITGLNLLVYAWENRGARFHRVRDFKQPYFNSIPPTSQAGRMYRPCAARKVLRHVLDERRLDKGLLGLVADGLHLPVVPRARGWSLSRREGAG